MVVAYLADEFEGGLYPLDGGPGWELPGSLYDGELYETNPKYSIPAYALSMMSIFHACTDGDGNYRVLPQAGGLYDQPAILMDALNHMVSCHRQILSYIREREQHRG
jgi:hypothetical protein